MANILRQSTAVDVLIGPFVDITDGATAETGESPTVKLSKNGQTLAAKTDATTPVHDADGYYNCELDATDTNTVGNLVLTVAASANALPVRHEFQVVETAIYDGIYGDGSTSIPADVVSISGDTTAADNAELAFDGTGYGFTNCTIPTATNLTNLPTIPTDWITAAGIATDAIGSDELAAGAVTKIWAQICETNGSRTAQQILSIALAALAGVTTDAGATLKDPAGTSTRISATINGSNERTAITLTPSS